MYWDTGIAWDFFPSDRSPASRILPPPMRSETHGSIPCHCCITLQLSAVCICEDSVPCWQHSRLWMSFNGWICFTFGSPWNDSLAFSIFEECCIWEINSIWLWLVANLPWQASRIRDTVAMTGRQNQRHCCHDRQAESETLLPWQAGRIRDTIAITGRQNQRHCCHDRQAESNTPYDSSLLCGSSKQSWSTKAVPEKCTKVADHFSTSHKTHCATHPQVIAKVFTTHDRSCICWTAPVEISCMHFQ